MCGRIYNIIPKTDGFEPILGHWPNGGLQSYNIAPSQTVPIITQDGTIQARWGLIPSWSKEFSSKYSTFNTRIETAAEKPVYKGAWNAKRSCLVPVGGYYEWKAEETGKQPYVINFGCAPMLLAGLWEAWNDQHSFTVITQQATGSLKLLHHRMPLVIHTKDAHLWLKERHTKETSEEWAETVTYYKVSKAINNARNDGEELMAQL